VREKSRQTLKMTSVQVVETSVTNNSSFQNYLHPDDHTIRNYIFYWPGARHLQNFVFTEVRWIEKRKMMCNRLTDCTEVSSKLNTENKIALNKSNYWSFFGRTFKRGCIIGKINKGSFSNTTDTAKNNAKWPSSTHFSELEPRLVILRISFWNLSLALHV